MQGFCCLLLKEFLHKFFINPLKLMQGSAQDYWSGNKVNFHYFMVKNNTFLGRVVASFAVWWTDQSTVTRHWQTPANVSVKGKPPPQKTKQKVFSLYTVDSPNKICSWNPCNVRKIPKWATIYIFL
jgi:hypothetical protein